MIRVVRIGVLSLGVDGEGVFFMGFGFTCKCINRLLLGSREGVVFDWREVRRVRLVFRGE